MRASLSWPTGRCLARRRTVGHTQYTEFLVDLSLDTASTHTRMVFCTLVAAWLLSECSTLIITSPLINGGAATGSRSVHVFFMLLSTSSSQML